MPTTGSADRDGHVLEPVAATETPDHIEAHTPAGASPPKSRHRGPAAGAGHLAGFYRYAVQEGALPHSPGRPCSSPLGGARFPDAWA